MKGYSLFMAPLEKLYLAEIRKKVMPEARGKVLEVGFGNGANMNYYDFKKIDSLHALDINKNMHRYDHVTYHVLDANKLPFDDESFDTIVSSLALCTISDQISAIKEIKRVLKKEGIYIFIEHVKPKSKILARVFDLINPLWRRMARGCQLILESHKNIEREGFKLSYESKGVFYYGVANKF